MARIRSVKPDFFRHELLNQLEEENPTLRVMLSFQGLWLQSDKQGVFPYKPKTLKLDILPWVNYRLEDTLALLVEHKFIIRFTHGGNEYGYIPSFPTHQRISGEEAKQQARYPSYDMRDKEGSRKEAGEKQEGNTNTIPACPGNGVGERERSREEGEGSAGAPLFSLQDELNPNRKDIMARIERARLRCLELGGPLASSARKLITHLHPDREPAIFATFASFTDSEIDQALANLANIAANPAQYRDPGFRLLDGFLATGVEQFVDAARPGDRFRIAARARSPTPQTVPTDEPGEEEDYSQ